MSAIENMTPLLAIACVTGLLSFYYLFSCLVRVRRLRLIGAVGQSITFTFFAAITGLISLILFGTQGYQRLTKEEPVAELKVERIDEQHFQAQMTFPDGSFQIFSLKGDELLVDAYILKWKPWANLFGLHSAYRLERMSGRYKSIEDEQNQPRSVFAINSPGDTGIAQWRSDYSSLSFLLDVEHGSASFVDAKEAEYQLMVTTDGLLIRSLEK